MRYHASSFAFVSTLSNVHVHTLKASSKGEKVPASWSHHDDPLPLTPAAEAGSRGPCPGGTVSKVAWLCIYIYIYRERRIRFLLEERTEIEDPSYVDRFLHYSGIPVYSLACIGNPIPPPPPPLYFYLLLQPSLIIFRFRFLKLFLL